MTTTTTIRKNGPDDTLGWNWMKRNYSAPDHETYMEHLNIRFTITDLPEWETVVGSYSIEFGSREDEANREVALNLLSSITGLSIYDIAHQAMREARSRDLNFEYSVGLG